MQSQGCLFKFSITEHGIGDLSGGGVEAEPPITAEEERRRIRLACALLAQFKRSGGLVITPQGVLDNPKRQTCGASYNVDAAGMSSACSEAASGVGVAAVVDRHELAMIKRRQQRWLAPHGAQCQCFHCYVNAQAEYSVREQVLAVLPWLPGGHRALRVVGKRAVEKYLKEKGT